MKREIAVQSVDEIRAASVAINTVARMFRNGPDDVPSKQMVLACGRVLGCMHDELLKPIFAAFPDLEAESRRMAFEALQKCGGEEK